MDLYGLISLKHALISMVSLHPGALFKWLSTLTDVSMDSSLQKLFASQNRRSEKTFLTMRVLEFTQMYSVVPIVLEIAVFPVDTD